MTEISNQKVCNKGSSKSIAFKHVIDFSLDRPMEMEFSLPVDFAYGG